MKNSHRIIGIGIAASISGCAYHRMPELSQYTGATYEPWMSAEALSAITFDLPASKSKIKEALPVCVAQHVTNREVSLSDSSSSFWGPYSGRYYNLQRTYGVGGGNVIQQVGDDGRVVVAQGVTRYQAGALVERYVRFTLTARQLSTGTSFRFAALEQAQANTGAVANMGYTKIGSFAGSNPDQAAATLKVVADNIYHCLSSN